MQTLFKQAGKLFSTPFYSVGFMAGALRSVVDFKSYKSTRADITGNTWMLGNATALTLKFVGAAKAAATISPILMAWSGIAVIFAPDPLGSLKQGYRDARGIEPQEPGNSSGIQPPAPEPQI